MCVVFASDSYVYGNSSVPWGDYRRFLTRLTPALVVADLYPSTINDAPTQSGYELILSDFDDTLVLAGSFGTVFDPDVTNYPSPPYPSLGAWTIPGQTSGPNYANWIGTGAGNDLVIAVGGSSMNFGVNIWLEEGDDALHVEDRATVGYVNGGAGDDVVNVARGGYANGGIHLLSMEYTVALLFDNFGTHAVIIGQDTSNVEELLAEAEESYDVAVIGGIVSGQVSNTRIPPAGGSDDILLYLIDFAIWQGNGELYMLSCGQVFGLTVTRASVLSLASGASLGYLVLWDPMSDGGVMRSGATMTAGIVGGLLDVTGFYPDVDFDSPSNDFDVAYYSSAHTLLAVFLGDRVQELYHSNSDTSINVIIHGQEHVLVAGDDVTIGIWIDLSDTGLGDISIGNRFTSLASIFFGAIGDADNEELTTFQMGTDGSIDIFFAETQHFFARFGARYHGAAFIWNEENAGEQSVLIFESDANIPNLWLIDDITLVLYGASVSTLAHMQERENTNFAHYFLCGTEVLASSIAGEFTTGQLLISPSSTVHDAFYEDVSEFADGLPFKKKRAAPNMECSGTKSGVLATCDLPYGRGCKCDENAFAARDYEELRFGTGTLFAFLKRRSTPQEKRAIPNLAKRQGDNGESLTEQLEAALENVCTAVSDEQCAGFQSIFERVQNAIPSFPNPPSP